MPLKPFKNWDEGLLLDMDKEFWPFVKFFEPFPSVIPVRLNKRDYPFQTAFFEENLNFSKTKYLRISQHVGEGKLMRSSPIHRIHTKTGVILSTIEEMQEFLLT